MGGGQSVLARDQHDPAEAPVHAGSAARTGGRRTAYDALGRPYRFNSGGNQVGEVLRVYNGLGQLATEYQSYGGSVDLNTSPRVSYAYDFAHGGRLSSMTYPGGRVLSYNYTAGVDDAIGRVSSVSDSVVGGTIETYSYLGLSDLAGRSLTEEGLNVTQSYYGQSGAGGDGGDAMTGLDRFGRVVDQGWKQNGTTYLDRFQYGYDSDSNLLYRDNLVNAAFGELFQDGGAPANGTGITAYDRLNRLQQWTRGTLNRTAPGTRLNKVDTPYQRYQSWTLDAQGNWLRFFDGKQTNLTAYDAQNRAMTASQSTETNPPTPPTPVTYTYDKIGNVVESTNSIHRKVTYDAWGRAVKTQVLDGKNTVVDQAEYRYDALGRTVREMFRYEVGAPLLELYYDAAGHVIQENKLTVDWGQGMRHWRDNIYSPVDGRLVFVEDQNPNAQGALSPVRLYALQDAQGSTTSTLIKEGSQYVVKERYVYDPYGMMMVLKPDWSGYAQINGKPYGNDPGNGRNKSLIDFRYLYKSGRWFQGDRLYHFGSRSYDPILPPSAQPFTNVGSFGYGNVSSFLGTRLFGNSFMATNLDTELMMFGYYGSDAAGQVWSGAGEGAKGGLSIAANTFTFGGTDYLGWTESWQYEGSAYAWSMAFATLSRESFIAAGTMGLGNYLTATRYGSAAVNMLSKAHYGEYGMKVLYATRAAEAAVATRGIVTGGQQIYSGYQAVRAGDPTGYVSMLSGGIGMYGGVRGLGTAVEGFSLQIDPNTLGTWGGNISIKYQGPIRQIGGRAVGAYDDVGGHHIIQSRAVEGINGVTRGGAPTIDLGSSLRRGTPHALTRGPQRLAGGGTYAAERRIGYRALRRAGLEPEEARLAIEEVADPYFFGRGITMQTPTNRVLDRR